MFSFDIFTNTYLAVSIVSLFFVYLYLHWKSGYWRRRGVDGPPSYPLIGTLWENLLHPSNELEVKRYQKYGKIYGAMQGWVPVLTIGEPELIKQIKITDFRSFTDHRRNFPEESLAGKNLVDLKGNEWKRVRNILSPVFSTGKLKAMQPLINQCIGNSLRHIENIANEKREVDIKQVVMSYTMDTIATCAFAMKTNVHDNSNNEFLRKARDIIKVRVWRLISSLILPGRLQILFNLQVVEQSLIDYFENLLKSVIKERKQKNIKENDFVNLLLDAELSKDETESQPSDTRKKLTDEEIIAQSMLFFVVGYETTSTLLQFTLYALAMHPKVQQTLFEEIRNYFQSNESIEIDSMLALPYFNAVINESLRLYTPVVVFEHICGEKYELSNTGITIEKGTVINLPYYAIHHDPELFPEPYEFKPERFLPENRDQIHPHSFLPFGTGPRNCIGMRFATLNAKLFLLNLLKHFEVVPTKNTTAKPEFNGPFLFLSCKPLRLTFRKRTQ